MNDFAATIVIILIFYGGLAWWLYSAVKNRIHKSRSPLRSFLFVLGMMFLALLSWAAGIGVLNAVIDIPRNQAVTMGFAAAIIVSLIRLWSWCINKLGCPKTKISRAQTDDKNL